jgi:hypothetical protein
VQVIAARDAIKFDCGVGSLLLATPGVIFRLWLMIVPERLAVLRPKECRCDAERHQVSCYKSSLTAVPSIPLTNVKELWFEWNNLTLLERNCFVSRGQTELKSLTLWFCKLSAIVLGAFNVLTKLTELNLSGNK